MPESSPAAPRVYTIPPSAPFLTTLARAILAGDLPSPGGAPPDPLTLPFTTIYLPTRRAARALRDAFLTEAKRDALLLPRIRTLGDPDEEAAIIFETEDNPDDDGALGAPAIAALPRRLALMRLVLAFAKQLRAGATAERGVAAPPLVDVTPGQASYLAADLANLMDDWEREEIDLSKLEEIVPEEFAGHWQLTVDFLKIVTEHWPEYLKDNGLASPIARRNALMAREATRLARGSPYPVIGAGSTGTVPATARLLEVIASLPNGAVVLPGLDKTLDDRSWEMLAEHPEHPQAGMAELLHKIGLSRAAVDDVPGSTPDGPARARLDLASETMRPADSTEHWQTFLSGEASTEARTRLGAALDGIRLVEAPTAHDEAEAIALILRSAIETQGKTAALITPDRVLARRVAARLRRYDLSIDDSAGVPAARTVPGAFLDLVLGAIETDFAPPELMALLKHPLSRLGRHPAEARGAARALELGAFRDVYLGHGLAGARAALEAAQQGPRPPLKAQAHRAALQLVADLERAFAPLAALFRTPAPRPASLLAQAHVAVAEALARDGSGASSELWQGDAGEALAVSLAQLIDAGESIELDAADYPPFYRSLVAGQAIRPRAARHPRLFIWGPLEARLQQPDLVILGSLNEGVWPRHQEAGPWLSRPMREKLGLSPPERRTGLAAHDFAQALGAREVYLTRAEKVDGVPTVPSRWLQRLLALVEAAKLKNKIEPAEPWAQWARERDSVPEFKPIEAPRPCPPVAARPSRLSVTRIERWIANPYEIFAKHILKLEPMQELGMEPDAAMRGQIVHQAVQDFARLYPDALPNDIESALVGIADEHFAKLAGSPVVEAFWRPQLRRFARWFAATEPARRAGILRILSEVNGALDLDRGFRLTARADRIDVAEGGSVVIYDYKTGKPPVQKHVDEHFAPQLSLEAAIAEAGGFEGLEKSEVSRLVYIHVSGRNDGGEERAAGKTAPQVLAEEAIKRLDRLIARYADPNMPYEVKRRRGPFSRAYDYDSYEHLARVKEWLTQEAEEDFP